MHSTGLASKVDAQQIVSFGHDLSVNPDMNNYMSVTLNSVPDTRMRNLLIETTFGGMVMLNSQNY